MPLTRPAVISDRVSLSDKLGRKERTFVPEDSAFDSFLLWQGVVDIVSPNKEGVSSQGSQDNVVSWPDKLISLSSISVSLLCRVVPLVKFKAGFVAVLCEPPVSHSHFAGGSA
jgi:hypothetical protein